MIWLFPCESVIVVGGKTYLDFGHGLEEGVSHAHGEGISCILMDICLSLIVASLFLPLRSS